MIPNHIAKYQIYDIFYNTKLIIIRPAETDIDIYVNDKKCSLYRCPHQHTFIYTLTIPFTPTISLRINNQIIHTHVNKYSELKDEIILSTIVKNEDKYIKQWIDFHLHIGITRFIIYDNSISNTLSTLLQDYIQLQQVILIQWSFPYILLKSGISGQTTQQNHSIYAFQSKYIGLLDIDEYVNMQSHTNIHTFFEDIIAKYAYDTTKIGGFTLMNKFFYNPNEMSTEGSDFLNIYNCDTISIQKYQKNFVIPKNVKTFSVHVITDGKPTVVLNETDVFFNHYIFLNKDRGKNKTNYTDDSISRHLKYRII